MSEEMAELRGHGPIEAWDHVRRLESCKSCGHVRRVKVTRTTYKDGHLSERWEHLCGACQYLKRAANHRAVADQHERRARALFASRAKKQQADITAGTTRRVVDR